MTKYLKYLPLALALISLVAFLVGVDARVTSLEAEEYNTQSDVKSINTSITDIRVHLGQLDEKISGIKEDTSFIKSRLK